MNTKPLAHIKQDEPAACIVCLSCLNNGRVLGKWISAHDAAAELADETQYPYAGQGEPATYPNTETAYVRCRKCGGDEWELADHEYTPHSCRSVKNFYENAAQLAELHENKELDQLNSLASWLDIGGYMTLDELIAYNENYYYGAYGSDSEFADNYIDGIGELDTIPEHLQRHFDMDSYTRELMDSYTEQNGHYWRSDV